MRQYDYHWYKLIKRTGHLHNVDKELSYLRNFLKQHMLEKVEDTIDIGCGDGSVSDKLKNILGLNKIHGYDVNRELLKKAKKRGVVTYEGDFNNIDIGKKFDLVICYGTLHHSSDKKKTIENIARSSNKYILIVDLTTRKKLWHRITNNRFYRFDATGYRIWSKENIEQSLLDEGCEIIKSVTLKNANFFHDRSIILAKK